MKFLDWVIIITVVAFAAFLLFAVRICHNQSNCKQVFMPIHAGNVMVLTPYKVCDCEDK